MPPAPLLRARLAGRRWAAEIAAAGWEVFSALLFASAVVPAASATPLPPALLTASLLVSAALGRTLSAGGPRGHAIAAFVRAISWPLAALPLLRTTDTRVIGAALVFGLMAAAVRRAIYRLAHEPPLDEIGDAELAKSLRSRLGEAAMVAGIVGGHVLLLFSVAFLRTQSRVNFEMWFFIVPVLALPATLGFSIVVRLASIPVIRAVAAGPSGDRAALERGLVRARVLPSLLAYFNFVVWFLCTAVGIFAQRPGPASWNVGDAVLQLGFASLFSWGVAFYQRAFHRDTVAVAVRRLRGWTRAGAPAETLPLGRRMLRDFGLPLIFTCLLSLLSSIGLYRALASHLSAREDANAVFALFGAFGVLVLAVGGVVVRAARDLSRPMVELARAADRVAHGELTAHVPEVAGPVEVVTLGESVERMRERLSRTIAELSEERAGLEANVAARTAELTRTLEELRRTQAALIQGERLASIGEMVAGVAHEINNPLNAIAGAAVPLVERVPEIREMLDAYRAAEPDLPPARREAIASLRARLDLDASLDDLTGITTVIHRAVDRSVKIVQNLLRFSRVSGEAVPTDLHVGLEETLMLLAPRLRQAKVEVVRRFGDVPQVVCRGGEINQVFMNLLVNAIQALEDERPDVAPEGAPPGPPPGGRGPTIVIETRVEGEMVVVSVSDNGPGVPAELSKKVFDPFFTTKPRGQGTGLGLSISSDIARRHGGSLSLEPAGGSGAEPGSTGEPPSAGERRGARFVCALPLGRRPLASRPTPTPGDHEV